MPECVTLSLGPWTLELTGKAPGDGGGGTTWLGLGPKFRKTAVLCTGQHLEILARRVSRETWNHFPGSEDTAGGLRGLKDLHTKQGSYDSPPMHLPRSAGAVVG